MVPSTVPPFTPFAPLSFNPLPIRRPSAHPIHFIGSVHFTPLPFSSLRLLHSVHWLVYLSIPSTHFLKSHFLRVTPVHFLQFSFIPSNSPPIASISFCLLLLQLQLAPFTLIPFSPTPPVSNDPLPSSTFLHTPSPLTATVLQ